MHLGFRLLSALSLACVAFSLGSGEGLNVGRPCTFDPERPDAPHCILTGNSGMLFVSSKYLRQLRFNHFGLAPVFSREQGWMYVNHQGRVVVSGVAEMDNWADSFHDGLVRVVKSGKYGFVNRRGVTVVPPAYDGALNFRNGSAEVCRSCRCEDPGAEHCALVGGEWFALDVHGRVIARLRPQSGEQTARPSQH